MKAFVKGILILAIIIVIVAVIVNVKRHLMAKDIVLRIIIYKFKNV
jgi:hypothetical protein